MEFTYSTCIFPHLIKLTAHWWWELQNWQEIPLHSLNNRYCFIPTLLLTVLTALWAFAWNRHLQCSYMYMWSVKPGGWALLYGFATRNFYTWKSHFFMSPLSVFVIAGTASAWRERLRQVPSPFFGIGFLGPSKGLQIPLRALMRVNKLPQFVSLL